MLLELIITSVLFLIPVLIACIFSRVYNVILGFMTYLLVSYIFLKILESVDADLLVTLKAEDALYFFKGFIDKIFVLPVRTAIESLRNKEIKQFLFTDLIQYSLMGVAYSITFALSIFLRKKRLSKFKKRRM